MTGLFEVTTCQIYRNCSLITTTASLICMNVNTYSVKIISIQNADVFFFLNDTSINTFNTLRPWKDEHNWVEWPYYGVKLQRIKRDGRQYGRWPYNRA